MANIEQLKRIGFNIEEYKSEWEHAVNDIKNANHNIDKSKRITSSGRRFHESKISKMKRGICHGIVKENEK